MLKALPTLDIPCACASLINYSDFCEMLNVQWIKKKNINFNTNYRREMKFVPINMDYFYFNLML